MATHGKPRWPHAIWIGTLDLPVDFSAGLGLCNSDGYKRARLLVRQRGRPLAFVELDVFEGSIDAVQLSGALERIAELGMPGRTDRHDAVVEPPPVSVVICTRNRPDLLKSAVESVLNCQYPSFDVIVVDNASDDDATLRYVEKLNDARVRVILESTPGLAVARNAGVRAATGEVVAFTDDDVVVDPEWLRWLAGACAGDSRVACATGLVPSGEVRTPTQKYFEERVSWSRCLERKTFDMADPPRDSPLFPFRVGDYGTGASFAVRRDVLFKIGGFDEALGVGSPTGGGEDIDMFVRLVVGGYKLVYEPAAIVWHRHRDDVPALSLQARGYGLGLGAWLTKVAFDNELRRFAVPKFVRALVHMRTISQKTEVEGLAAPAKLGRIQFISTLRGPFAYLRSRIEGRRSAPLLEIV